MTRVQTNSLKSEIVMVFALLGLHAQELYVRFIKEGEVPQECRKSFGYALTHGRS